jgi:FAD/FMN-containing dehydrogenase
MEILRACAEAGGTVSGEHGIGLEKREALPMVFGDGEIEAMRTVKSVFDPEEQCNPGKIFLPVAVSEDSAEVGE